MNMSNKVIKWGFIGCGNVTEQKSGPAFKKIEGSEVVAVMSRDELPLLLHMLPMPSWL